MRSPRAKGKRTSRQGSVRAYATRFSERLPVRVKPLVSRKGRPRIASAFVGAAAIGATALARRKRRSTRTALEPLFTESDAPASPAHEDLSAAPLPAESAQVGASDNTSTLPRRESV